MRLLSLLLTGLLSAALLSGCSQAPDSPSAEPTDTASDDSGRTAREGHGSAGEEDGVDLRAIEILHVPLQMSGQGPESFDAVVPPDVDSVSFRFAGGPTFDAAGLRVELTGCGSYDGGMGFMGSTGGDFSGDLCGAADAGPQTVTVSGTLVVFDGTFVVTAYVPANATAA